MSELKELTELKREIDNTNQRIAELRGKLEHLKGVLKEEWDCSNTRAAKALMGKMEEQAKKLQAEIDVGFGALHTEVKKITDRSDAL